MEEKRPAPLKAKVTVGAATLRKTYKPDDTAFNVADIPASSKAAKKDVRKAKKANILGLERPSWDQSTVVPEPLCKRQGRVLGAHDRPEFTYNYRAETLPDPPPLLQDGVVFARSRSAMAATKRTEEMPVNPRLLDKPAWDSTAQLDRKLRAKDAVALDTAAKRSTTHKNSRLKDYVSPVEREKEHMATLRAARVRGEEPSGGAGEDSDAVKHSAAAYSSVVSRKFKRYHHTGTFEKTQFAKGKVWSCCMSEDPDGQGCIVTTVNPDAYNFVSIS